MKNERKTGLPEPVIRLIGDLRASLLTMVESQYGISPEADTHIESLRSDLARLDPSLSMVSRIRLVLELTTAQSGRLQQQTEFTENIYELIDRLANVFIASYPSKTKLMELRQNIERHSACPDNSIIHCLNDLSMAIQVISDLQKEEQQVMSDYVNDMQRRLSEIDEIIMQSYTTASDNHEAVSSEHTSRMDDLSQIERKVAESNSLETLRNSMTSSIAQLAQRMNHYHAEQMQRQVLAMDEVKRARGELQMVRTELVNKGRELHTDALTRLPNRGAFQDQSQLAFAAWLNPALQHRVSIVVIDVDFFKTINDEFGHVAGDRVLSILGSTLCKALGEDGFLARWGGEEFALICNKASASDATQVAIRLRNALADTRIVSDKGTPISVTVSFGIAELTRGETMEDCFRKADEAMYMVKHAGRNGIACHYPGAAKPTLIVTGRCAAPSSESPMAMETAMQKAM